MANRVSERLYAPVAQLDRALACGARGRKFESCRVYQLNLRRGMKFIKYTGLAIIAIFATFIASMAAAAIFGAATWSEVGEWSVRAAALSVVGLLLSSILSVVGVIVAKDSNKPDKK